MPVLTRAINHLIQPRSALARRLTAQPTRKMTVSTFYYIDPSTIAPDVTPWAKVDIDYTSYGRTHRRRSVSNLRDLPAENFGTDLSGFSVHHSPANEKAFTDDAAVRGPYYDEVEALLRAKLPGVKKVIFFDHTIRKHDPAAARQPVQQVHVDQTPGAAVARVRRHLPADEAEELLKGRYQIINIWRPIGHPATDFPLAVIDWRTTEPKDLVAVALMYPKRGEGDDGDDRGKETRADPATASSREGYEAKGETYGIAPNEKHKFYYVKDMTPDEAMFIKCFDSRSQGLPGGREGVAALTPHTAFIDPDTPSDAKGRESIEVRALVFYDE